MVSRMDRRNHTTTSFPEQKDAKQRTLRDVSAVVLVEVHYRHHGYCITL